jgi:trans-aconitate methyltransferase
VGSSAGPLAAAAVAAGQMVNQITDRAFWEQYWRSKPDLAIRVNRNYKFHRLLRSIVSARNVKTAIELGGFPGYYAIFLTKFCHVRSTLFDYFIDEHLLRCVLERNDLQPEDVEVVEADLFNGQPLKQFDLVLSCGLVEHFEDTTDVIKRHVQLLKSGGTLFVTLPNFTGVNGWVQRRFDAANYEKHNTTCMDPALLTRVCRELGLSEVSCNYNGKFSVWLERREEKPALVRWLVKWLWFAGKAFTTVIPFDSKSLSPYIVLIARKA